MQAQHRDGLHLVAHGDDLIVCGGEIDLLIADQLLLLGDGLGLLLDLDGVILQLLLLLAELDREPVQLLDDLVILLLRGDDFTSDVHYDGKNLNLKTWLEAAEADVGYIDSMGFCGDMGSAYANVDQFWQWTGEIMDYMDSQIAEGKVGSAVYTHGNHE